MGLIISKKIKLEIDFICNQDRWREDSGFVGWIEPVIRGYQTVFHTRYLPYNLLVRVTYHKNGWKTLFIMKLGQSSSWERTKSYRDLRSLVDELNHMLRDY